MNKFYLGLSLLALCTSHVSAAPANIIIIRHANKIPGAGPMEGKNHLDQQGYERSAALAYYFSGTPMYNKPPISFVFAAGLAETDSSVRPIETCTPTASHYKLPLNIQFTPTQTRELAQELLNNPVYNGATVLVCWEHHNVRPLVLALGGEDPGEWPYGAFDMVYYMSDFVQGKKPTLSKIMQKLMYGDRPTIDAPLPATPEPTTHRIDED